MSLLGPQAQLEKAEAEVKKLREELGRATRRAQQHLLQRNALFDAVCDALENNR